MKDLNGMLNDIEQEVKLTSHLIDKHQLDPRVMDALKKVPRHEFLPENLQHLAYIDGPAPIGCGQTISQPYMVALMTDLLNTKPSDIILEIGSGSGYQAAILSQLVTRVYSLEIIQQLAENASNRLKKLGCDNVVIRNGNGYYGWAEFAPYDGIIVTAAAPHIPQALIDQLKIGARLVIPIGWPYAYQELTLITKTSPTTIDNQAILGVSFVPLTGINHKPSAATPAYGNDNP